MGLVADRDFETTPARYAAYLRDTYENSKRILGEPVQQWPRGSSHDISRQIMEEAQERYEDIVLEFGTFDAHGKLNGFADR